MQQPKEQNVPATPASSEITDYHDDGEPFRIVDKRGKGPQLPAAQPKQVEGQIELGDAVVKGTVVDMEMTDGALIDNNVRISKALRKALARHAEYGKSYGFDFALAYGMNPQVSPAPVMGYNFIITTRSPLMGQMLATTCFLPDSAPTEPQLDQLAMQTIKQLREMYGNALRSVN